MSHLFTCYNFWNFPNRPDNYLLAGRAIKPIPIDHPIFIAFFTMVTFSSTSRKNDNYCYDNSFLKSPAFGHVTRHPLHTCVKKTKRSLIRKRSFLLTLHEQRELQKLFVTSEKLVTS